MIKLPNKIEIKTNIELSFFFKTEKTPMQKDNNAKTKPVIIGSETPGLVLIS